MTLFLNDYGRCEITLGNIAMDEIVGQAADLLCDMPIDSQVFVTSSDLDFLTFMMYELSDYCIDDLVMVTPQEIINGHLRGKLGVLIQHDMRFLSEKDRDVVNEEAEILILGREWIDIYGPDVPAEVGVWE